MKGNYLTATSVAKDSLPELIQLLSIELKDTKATSEKKAEENKKEDKIKNPGNVSEN